MLVGSLAVWIGASVGATLAFLLGRFLMHEFVQGLLAKWKIMMAIDRSLEQRGLAVALLLRLSPVVPFGALNYALAGTSISLRNYVVALIGMLPATVAYVYLGATIQAAAVSATTTAKDSENEEVRAHLSFASILAYTSLYALAFGSKIAVQGLPC